MMVLHVLDLELQITYHLQFLYIAANHFPKCLDLDPNFQAAVGFSYIRTL